MDGKNVSASAKRGTEIERIREKYQLLFMAKKLAPDRKSLKACCAWMIPQRDTVEIRLRPATSTRRVSVRYSGVMTCGSVWACGVCAPVITEYRRVELDTGLRNWEERGGVAVLVTFTIRHYGKDKIGELLPGVIGAYRKMLQGRRALKDAAPFIGLVGSIRAVEMTWGEPNGWHPHLHVLYVFDRAPDEQAIHAWLASRWAEVVAAAGLRSVAGERVAVDVRRANIAIGDYLAKFAPLTDDWTIAHEMTKSGMKVGHLTYGPNGDERFRYTPWDLLKLAYDADRKPAALWQAYELHSRRKHQLEWSAGLKKLLLNTDVDLADGEIAEAPDADSQIIYAINKEVWRLVRRGHHQAEVLVKAWKGGGPAVDEFLRELIAEELERCPPLRYS